MFRRLIRYWGRDALHRRVLGLAQTFGEAFFKAQEATQTLPLTGTVLISVSDRDKPELPEVAQGFADCGFNILATSGTYDVIVKHGIKAEKSTSLTREGLTY